MLMVPWRVSRLTTRSQSPLKNPPPSELVSARIVTAELVRTSRLPCAVTVPSMSTWLLATTVLLP